LFRGLAQGAEASDKRRALDNTLLVPENRLGHKMAMYDVADEPSGLDGAHPLQADRRLISIRDR
jgi:hypothetical protein